MSEPATSVRRAAVTLAAFAAVALALFGYGVWSSWPASGDELGRIVLIDSILPRGAVALVTGASLGLAGALLQRVLRNPIADPSTLGVAAGAQLAMTAATIYAPALMASAREPIAFAGGLASLALILGLSWRRGLEPVTVVLCGMLISLVAASLSATIILANGEYMMSLFIWGGGSLEQGGWQPTVALALRAGLATVAVAIVYRPLVLLGFDDSSARALGLGVTGTRLLALGLAVFLATSTAAYVGVIGFIGLAAPNLARIAGARRFAAVLLLSPLIGAILLLLTDGLVQLAAIDETEIVPTGAATALFGGPLLLWLLPRLRPSTPRTTAAEASPRRLSKPGAMLALVAAAAVLLGIAALFVGPGEGGWTIATGPVLEAVAPWRWPRILSAAACGGMLAAAGFIMQRVSGNPLASPEVLGISAGSGVGLAAVLLFVPEASLAVQTGSAVSGALLALLVVLGLAASGHFGPERLLLGGIAVGSLSGALVTTVIARGGAEGTQLLNWLSGSTQLVGPETALLSTALAVALIAPLPLFSRWFAVLPLGPGVSRGVGLSPSLANGVLVLLAAILTAVATLTVGPLSFVGLMAPHAARLTGIARPAPQLLATVLIGMALMIFADWMARGLTFPYQLPLGLFASLVGGPYLVWLLNRGAARRPA
ncbi:Fe(3+)-hydroxamate ABC transporter permease FhuB [Mangrovicella endophytica]|uniref:Fe(3+)-hydroxamate ABC transporter permease FhuB n=1 Tax=Mangrovicella endophytica TaxID=2066697 RepID=UPI000C9EB1A9|nr:Fe(3+)-hydroxamate ABC transporter permease FhuB [Mangrovicella endophytica]